MKQGWSFRLGGCAIAPLALLGGCVTVNAPDKPIVINLNISITQEVVYRLDNKAKAIIQDNPGIF
ncbi:YnbE family lipoprotein [uncultured Sphingomonas sp.]|uniref:YnbE family lipoprotein n=1 Tax=uncultured Sphingomonas sp. TaxID=158754 RepID=UPI0025DDD912|nr:YnbE family lipoprotein [uncultured Sphingomonas sp.]